VDVMSPLYDFQKIKKEEIVMISDSAILKWKGKDRKISIILTNKRLLFLDNPSAVNNYEETMRTSRGMNYMQKKEPFFILALSQLENIEIGEFDQYRLQDGNYFLIQSEELRNELQHNYCREE